MELVIGILLLVMAVFLVISVLMQSSKNHRMSGTISGGAETFFGKQKGKSLDALFSKLTTIIAIIFVILVIVMYIIQPNPSNEGTVIDPSNVEDLINTEVEGTEDEGTQTDTTENTETSDDTTVEDAEGETVENTENTETVEGTENTDETVAE